MLGFVRILTNGLGNSVSLTLLAVAAAAGPNRSGRRGNSRAVLLAQAKAGLSAPFVDAAAVIPVHCWRSAAGLSVVRP